MTFIRESVMRNMILKSSFAILVEKSKEILHSASGIRFQNLDGSCLTSSMANVQKYVLVVSGTIAPSRGNHFPELTAEDAVRIILANLNLVVPVVAAVLVIIIAIIVICILRSKGHHQKGQ